MEVVKCLPPGRCRHPLPNGMDDRDSFSDLPKERLADTKLTNCVRCFACISLCKHACHLGSKRHVNGNMEGCALMLHGDA